MMVRAFERKDVDAVIPARRYRSRPRSVCTFVISARSARGFDRTFSLLTRRFRSLFTTLMSCMSGDHPEEMA
jgi:hypothetical protein